MERSSDLTPVNRRDERLRITSRRIEEAIAQGQIGVHFQPKICCATGAVHSFEALARWEHPNAGIILPGQFIGIAEREGLLSRITDIVLVDAMTWLVSVMTDGQPKACVNVSTAEIEDEGFITRLLHHCGETRLNPGSLIIEVTESRAIEDLGAALDFMTQLRVKGFHVAIDDVGAGYASPARLAHLPFSYMKLDQSFIRDIKESTRARHVVEHLIALGHKLDVQVVIEGIEDQATLDIVTALGCDIAQGFHIARPMAPDDAAAWFAEHTRH